MANNKLIRTLLRLVGLRVCEFWFKHRLKEFHLHVKPPQEWRAVSAVPAPRQDCAHPAARARVA